LTFKAFFWNMINYNGNLQEDTNFSLTDNRAFLYGDSLFDTIVYKENILIYIEAHYFRLVASMRQLRMEIPNYFTQEFWQNEIIKTLHANQLANSRIRTTIFRNAKGFYNPTSHYINFIIQVDSLVYQNKQTFKLGIYKDNYLNVNKINNLKTTNRIQNVLASIYSYENQLDSCVLLNHKKQIAEAIHANIFVVVDNHIKTPALTEGCIDGIIRKKLIPIIDALPNYQIEECCITPFELQQASEVFLTNSVIGIQSVTQYKKKMFTKNVGNLLGEKLKDNENYKTKTNLD